MKLFRIRLGVVDTENGRIPPEMDHYWRGLTDVYIAYCEDYNLEMPTVSPDTVSKFDYCFYDLLNKKDGIISLKNSEYNFTLSITEKEATKKGLAVIKKPVISLLGNKLRVMETDSKKINISAHSTPQQISEFQAIKMIRIGDFATPIDMIIGPKVVNFTTDIDSLKENTKTNFVPSVKKLLEEFDITDLSNDCEWECALKGRNYVLSPETKYVRKKGIRYEYILELIKFYKSFKLKGGKKKEEEDDCDCDCDEEDEDDEEYGFQEGGRKARRPPRSPGLLTEAAGAGAVARLEAKLEAKLADKLAAEAGAGLAAQIKAQNKAQIMARLEARAEAGAGVGVGAGAEARLEARAEARAKAEAKYKKGGSKTGTIFNTLKKITSLFDKV
jgi:hypothetical protein